MTPKDKALAFIEDNLPLYAQLLHSLALGELEPQVTERLYQPAGLLKDKSGNKKFPETPDRELVLTEERKISLPPDRSAAEYLIDRILGKPKAEVSKPGEGMDSKEIPASFSPPIGQYALGEQNNNEVQ